MTYQISKYLADFFTPMTKNENDMESIKHFINKMKVLKIDQGYNIVYLDVVSLFNSAPLDSQHHSG